MQLVGALSGVLLEHIRIDVRGGALACLLLVFEVHPFLLRVQQFRLLHVVLLGVKNWRRPWDLIVQVRLAQVVRGVLVDGRLVAVLLQIRISAPVILTSIIARPLIVLSLRRRAYYIIEISRPTISIGHTPIIQRAGGIGGAHRRVDRARRKVLGLNRVAVVVVIHYSV